MRRAVVLACAIAVGAAAHADSGPVPLRLLPTGDIGGLIALDLQLDGRPSRWLIDTGSSRHLVSPAFVQRLGLQSRGSVKADTAFGQFAGPEVELPPLRIGEQRLPSARAVVLDLRRLAGAAADDIDGVIGAPWLDLGPVTFDFAGWTVRAGGAPLQQCPASMQELPLQRQRGVPVLLLQVDGATPERVLFDTGNAAALVRVDADDAPPGPGVALPGMAATLARAATVSLGPLRRRDVPIAHLRAPSLRAALPADVRGLAGVALFDAGRLLLDLQRGRACVEPGDAAVPGGFGFTLERQGARLVVTAVLDGSPAEAAGLRAGDVVRRWNGGPPERVADAWSAVRGHSELALEVERDGASRALRVARAHFLPALSR